MATQTYTKGEVAGVGKRTHSLQMPDEGEIFRLVSSSDDVGKSGYSYGIMKDGKIHELSLKQMLLDDQDKWTKAMDMQVGASQRGQLLKDIQNGKETTIKTPDGEMVVSYRKEPGEKTGSYYVTNPKTGEEVRAWTGGGSKNQILGQIVRKGLGIEASIGYNVNPDDPKNIDFMREKLGLQGLADDQLNTYLRGQISAFADFADEPLDSQEAVQAIQSAPKGDQYGQFIKSGVQQADYTGEGDVVKQGAAVDWVMDKAGQQKPEGMTAAEWAMQKAKQAQSGQTGGTVQPGSPEQWAQTGQPGTAGTGADAWSTQTGGLGSTQLPQGSEDAMALVRKAFEMDATNNLQQYDWWNNSPVKQEAWELIQQITSTPESLAEYVKQQGFENLQNYQWWNDSPFKQDAWNLIKPTATDAEAYNMGYNEDTAENPTGGYDTPTGEPEPTGSPYQEAFDYIDSLPIPDEQKMFYKSVVEGWDPDAEINYENVLNEFQRIKNDTIDPYYQTMANQMIDEVGRARDFAVKEREMQMEQERFEKGQATRQMKEGLEKSGMTFTGKAIEELGKDAAYAQTAGNTAIPTQTDTEGMFYEGNVNQAARLMSSSNQARYLKNMASLAAEAESRLGSGQAALMGIPGAQLTGGVTGQLEEKKQQELADTLSGLAGQERQNVAYRNPITL